MDVGMASALAASSKANVQKVLPPVAAVSSASVVLSYVYLLRFGGDPNGATSFFKLSWRAHAWATMSVGLKIFDLGTDWGFLQHSLTGEAFESQYKVPDVNGTQQLRRFSETGRYDPNVRAIQSVALASCVLGTQFTLLDIYGTHQRLGKVVKLATKVTLGVMIVEDIPQLVINLIYMDTIKVNATSVATAVVGEDPVDYDIDTISYISLIASILNLVYSVYLIMADRCVVAKQQQQQQQAGGETVATTVNAAYKDSGVQMSNVAGFAVGAVGKVSITEFTNDVGTAARPDSLLVDVRQSMFNAASQQPQQQSAQLSPIVDPPDPASRPLSVYTGFTEANNAGKKPAAHQSKAEPSKARKKRRAHQSKPKEQDVMMPAGAMVRMSSIAGFVPLTSVGKPCIVAGVGSGIIRFVGLHAENTKPRIGVEMNKPKGKNNGTVNGHKYFKCKDGHGLLTHPQKVTISNSGADAKITNLDEYIDVDRADASVGSNV